MWIFNLEAYLINFVDQMQFSVLCTKRAELWWSARRVLEAAF